MAFKIIQPLQPAVTADGALKCGLVEIDDQTFRVECAMDDSWVCLYDDSLGDPMSYDVLKRRQDGTLQSDQPTLTMEWTPEHFAWLENCLTQEPQEPERSPETERPLFIRRPPQGFAIPNEPHAEQEVATEVPAEPPPDKKKLGEKLVISVFYFVFGLAAAQSSNVFVWLIGGFMILTSFRGFYESRKLFY